MIDGATIYVTASPCWSCFKQIANADLARTDDFTPANLALLLDALTAAGGISNSTDLARSKILRGDQEIVSGEEFVRGVTDIVEEIVTA